ncbi:MAG: aminotransferase class I/II-fold pyridoxal phosphate-dependent enzyme [bacterium]
MNKLIRPITISLSPNVEGDDIKLALKALLSLNRQWMKGASLKLEEEIRAYFSIAHAVVFNSGRSALWAILKSLNLNNGDEVLVQSFTCNAAVNPILWNGLMPVYCDINEDTLNIDIHDLENKITTLSKAVIVQHTFGFPADMEKIVEICERKGLILIEDCAHSLGATYRGKRVGTFGKVAYLSFSRDKVISSVYGGAVITNDEESGKKIKKLQKQIGAPKKNWTIQQLLHPVIMGGLILPTYGIFGKYLLKVFQEIKILSKAVHFREKRGLMPDYFPYALPDELAILVLNQWRKLERFNRHRQEIVDYYYSHIDGTKFSMPVKVADISQSYLRFTLKNPRAHEIIKQAWANNILIGDWYTNPVAPSDTKMDLVKYRPGSCPVSEKMSQVIFNLPTHIGIGEKEAKLVTDFVNSCV